MNDALKQQFEQTKLKLQKGDLAITDKVQTQKELQASNEKERELLAKVAAIEKLAIQKEAELQYEKEINTQFEAAIEEQLPLTKTANQQLQQRVSTENAVSEVSIYAKKLNENLEKSERIWREKPELE